MPVLKTVDVEIHYEVTGSGPPLILIAGLASDHASWGPVTPTLAKHFTLIMPDNRGCGQTRTSEAITIDVMAEDIVSLLDHIGHERAHVLGHSMGGIIAMNLAAAEPHRVDKLVLAASCAQKQPRAISVIDNILALREVGAPEEHWLRAFFHWLFKPSFFDNKNAVDAAIALAMAYPHAQTAANMRLQIDALREYDASGLPAAIKAETLLLAGELDLMFSPEQIEQAFATAENSVLQVLPGAAHSLHWDEPAAFCAAVAGFLEK
jgi:pimeloyl-ACP methyl ester carboxylesterase